MFNSELPLPTVLKGTSRSFYLSLRFLPRETRRAVALAYLLARASDTIADARLVSIDRRLELLKDFQKGFEKGGGPGDPLLKRLLQSLNGSIDNPAEKELLERLGEALDCHRGLPDSFRAHNETVLTTITSGQILDLEWFPEGESAERPTALQNEKELKTYCYSVAGCVGEYWTDIHSGLLRSLDADLDIDRLRSLGVRLGMGLQMTNILRDIPRDLRLGRCYLPGDRLADLGVEPADLLNPDSLSSIRPLIDEMLDTTYAHYDAGFEYVLGIPKQAVRLRLATLWPLLIGLPTLSLLRESDSLLDPEVVVKISRNKVYGLLVGSTLRVASNRWLRRLWKRLRKGPF